MEGRVYLNADNNLYRAYCTQVSSKFRRAARHVYRGNSKRIFRQIKLRYELNWTQFVSLQSLQNRFDGRSSLQAVEEIHLFERQEERKSQLLADRAFREKWEWKSELREREREEGLRQSINYYFSFDSCSEYLHCDELLALLELLYLSVDNTSEATRTMDKEKKKKRLIDA